MTYHVRKVSGGWQVSVEHADGGTTYLNTYKSKAKAVFAARALAGWRHYVVH